MSSLNTPNAPTVPTTPSAAPTPSAQLAASPLTPAVVLDPHAANGRDPSDNSIIQPLRDNETQDFDGGVGIYSSYLSVLGFAIGCLGAIPCMPCPNPFREVHQGSVGFVTQFGKIYKKVGPGLVHVNVCTESLKIVDLKIQVADVGHQNVITRDNVSVGVDSVIYFQITDSYRAAFVVADPRQALVERARTTLRHVVGARAVQAVVTDREAIALESKEIVKNVARKWGVTVESILIKDMTFSSDVAAFLESVARETHIGESKVIAARAEVDAARLRRQAADLLASSAAIQTMPESSQSEDTPVPMQNQSVVIHPLGGAQAGPSGSQLAIGGGLDRTATPSNA